MEAIIAAAREKLADGSKADELTALFNAMDTNSICKMVEDSLNEENLLSHELVRAIFMGSVAETESCQARRSQVLLSVMRWMGSKGGDASPSIDKISTEMVNFMIAELDCLPEPAIMEAAAFISDLLRSGGSGRAHGKIFEFLPKLLQILAARSSVTVREGGKSSTMNGAEFKDFFINRICSCRWHAAVATHLASVFRDIPLTNKQEIFVIKKILKQFDIIGLNEVPPLIYQLLLLSRKGHKRLILKGILDHFNHLDKVIKEDSDSRQQIESAEQVQSMSFAALATMEGTVKLHLCFAIKQDQELGTELLKFLKSGKTAYLTPFNVACLLSMARIHRFEDQVLDFLKLSILTCCKDADRLSKSHWIAEHSGWDPIDITDVFLRIIRKTTFGWDQATQTLVQLGWTIIDLAGITSGWGKTTDKASAVKKGLDRTPTDFAAELGARILLETFQMHDMVRSEILEQIFARVVAKSTSVLYFLDLLKIIVCKCPQAIMAYIPKIKDVLDYLSYLNLGTAQRFLQAVQPIIHLNPSFRDGLMLVLRKGMFTKDLEGRQVAVEGFLQLLRHPVAGGCNAPLEASSSRGEAVSEIDSLALEIIGTLRRCFSQQPDVRLRLYEGLSYLSNVRKDLHLPIFEILYPQFCKYYESDPGISAPVHLDRCVGSSGSTPGALHISEPLPFLLVCLSRTLVAANGGELDEDTHHLRHCCESLSSLVFRLCKADMEDFELDKSADFALTNNVGYRNNIYATLLLGVYEALMEYTLLTGNGSLEASETILKLFKKFNTLFDIVHEKKNSPRGRKAVTSIAEGSTMNLEGIANFCRLIFEQIDPNRQAAVLQLKEDAAFVKYIISVAHARLAKFEVDCGSLDEQYRHLVTLGRIFVKGFYSAGCGLMNPNEAGGSKKDKGKSLIASIVECFTASLHTVSSQYPDKLAHFLLETLPSSTTEMSSCSNVGRIIGQHVECIQKMIRSFMDDRVPLTKESSSLFQALTLLAQHIPKSCGQEHPAAVQLSQWTLEFCRENFTEDPALAKSSVSLLLNLKRNSGHYDIGIKFAESVHGVLGNIQKIADEEEPDDFEPAYKTVNLRTCPVIITALINLVDQTLDDLEWSLAQLKFVVTVGAPIPVPHTQLTQISGFENHICDRLTSLISILVEIEQAAIPAASSEPLLRTLQKVYRVLVALTKYKISEGKKPTQHFIGVIEITGRHLASHMYAHITWLQNQDKQEEETRRKKKGNAKADGKRTSAAQTKIMKESKMIPNLIYMVEQFERYLIQLTKKCKVNLTQHLKRSTARDFRIQVNQIQEIPLVSEEEEEEELKKAQTERETVTEEQNGSDVENEAPLVRPNKRARV